MNAIDHTQAAVIIYPYPTSRRLAHIHTPTQAGLLRRRHVHQRPPPPFFQRGGRRRRRRWRRRRRRRRGRGRATISTARTRRTSTHNIFAVLVVV